MKKTLWGVLLVIIVVCTVCVLTVFAGATETVVDVANGYVMMYQSDKTTAIEDADRTETELTWKVQDITVDDVTERVLTIEGEDTTLTFNSKAAWNAMNASTIPWYADANGTCLLNTITKIVIKAPITAINQSCVFNRFAKVHTVVLPETDIKLTGSMIFAGMNSLTTLGPEGTEEYTLDLRTLYGGASQPFDGACSMTGENTLTVLMPYSLSCPMNHNKPFSNETKVHFKVFAGSPSVATVETIKAHADDWDNYTQTSNRTPHTKYVTIEYYDVSEIGTITGGVEGKYQYKFDLVTGNLVILNKYESGWQQFDTHGAEWQAFKATWGSYVKNATVEYFSKIYFGSSTATPLFAGMENLETVTFKAGQRMQNGGATTTGWFQGCTALKSITFGGELAGGVFDFSGMFFHKDDAPYLYLTNIFNGCTAVKEVILPDSAILTTVNANTFKNCTSLQKVTLLENITTIEDGSFADCPDVVIYVIRDSYAHTWAVENNVDYVLIGEETAAPESDFEYTINSDGVSVTITKYVGNGGDVIIPSTIAGYSVTSISENSFEECFNLANVYIPDSVTDIGTYAFFMCDNLVTVTIPESVTNIGKYAFNQCGKLETIEVSEANTKYSDIDGVLFDKEKKKLIDYPDGGATEYCIPDGVTTIAERAFELCFDLVSLIIPESVVAIGDSAFHACESLESITIPNSITSIGDGVFYACMSLTSITIPDNVVNIGDSAFDGCINLTSITIPNSVTSIGDWAFAYCSSLESVTFQTKNATIASKPFNYCESLETIYLYKNSTADTYFSSDEYTKIYLDEEQSSPESDFEYTINSDGVSVTITKYVGNGDDVIIPSTIAGYSVTSIGDESFENCGDITSVTIPDSVMSIGWYAFGYCSNLTSIVIPDSVTNISAGAFEETAYYNDLANWDNELVLYIGNHLICAKTSISGDYVVRNGVKTIANNAFGICKQLTGVTIPNSVISIGYSAFQACESITSIIIPDSVTSIGEEAFEYCYSLTTIDVDENNKDYCDLNGVLYSKDMKTIVAYPAGGATTYVIPNGVVNIGNTSFWYCRKLSNLTIPDSVISIGSSAFVYCDSLVNLTIPDSVEHIGKYAFLACESLESIAFYTKDTTIDALSFEDCPKLKTIYLYKDSTADEFFSSDEYTKIYLNEEQASPESDFEYTVNSDGVSVTITKYVGNGGDVVIPSKIAGYSVTDIGRYAFDGHEFEGCNNMTSVIIPDSVTSIGGWAFRVCSKLKSVTISSNITSIDEYTFYYCSSLTSITIPNSVKSIGKWAFGNCMNLASVTISDNVTSIGDSAFFGCSSLANVTIPDSVTSIGISAFSWCESLTSISIPKSITSIGYEAFYACINLAAIEVNENNENYCDIEGVLFRKDKKTIVAYPGNGATTYVVPDGVTSIDSSAFAFCKKLTSVTIPDSVTEIGDYAFRVCDNLESITFETKNATIGLSAFEYCDTLETIYLYKDSTADVYFSSDEYTKIYLDEEPELPESDFEYEINADGVSIKIIGYKGEGGDIVIPETIDGYTVTGLNTTVFHNLDTLTGVTLPKTLVSLPGWSFVSCSNLKYIKVEEGNEVFFDIDGVLYAFNDSDETMLFIYPAGKTENSYTIPDSIKYIARSAFEACQNLVTIVIPNGVETIGNSAFKGCTNLKTMIIPESVELMFANSFDSNTLLGVYENSYAHTFAEENDIPYFIINKPENPEVHYGTSIVGSVKYNNGSAVEGAYVNMYYSDGTLKESVLTDENGSYTFAYAEVGSYSMKATDEYGNSSLVKVEIKRINEYDVTVSGSTDIVLKKGYTVSGNVNIFPAKVTISDAKGNVIATITTNDGSFAFDNIPSGSYIITTETEDGRASSEITVFDGNISDIVLDIITDTATIWGYVEIEDRDGKTGRQNWVDVSLYDENGNIISSVKSDKDGKYTFTKIPVGDYSIVATVYEMRPDKKHGYDRSHKLEGYEYISVIEPGMYQVETIVLYEENDHLTTISGNITLSGKNTPCEVILRNVFGIEIARTVTEKAKYSFKNVPDGFYYITAITEEDGMGFTVVIVRGGKVKGKTNIHIFKHDKIKNREDKFKDEIPEFTKDEAELYRDRIAEEKRFYDGLSEKEKKQVSKSYLERLNRYVEWLAACEYITPEGVTVDRGGLVVSGDELEAKDEISFTITVEKQEKWEDNENGIESDRDFIHHEMKDKTKGREIVQYYEISMTKTTNGENKTITSVYKDTDAMGKFKVTMDIPEEYKGYKHYSILHVHCGEVVTLADLDDDPNTVTFEVDKFSTFALVATDTELVTDEFVPTADFMTFEGYQVREEGYNGLRSLFTVDFTAMPTLENDVFEVIEVGAIFASTEKLTAGGDEFVVTKSDDGSYKTLSYGMIVPILKNGALVGKYISKTEDELVFACTITNFDATNYNKLVSSRGYAVLADADGNEYVVYCDYEFEEYRSVSLEMICDALYEAGQITEDNMSYSDVVAFRKEE